MKNLVGSFSFRIMVIAFVGTHIPLLTVLVYFLFGPGTAYSALEIFLVTLLATLTAAIATLLFIDKEVRPVREVVAILRNTPPSQVPANFPAANNQELDLLFTSLHESLQEAHDANIENQQLVSALSTNNMAPYNHVKERLEVILSDNT